MKRRIAVSLCLGVALLACGPSPTGERRPDSAARLAALEVDPDLPGLVADLERSGASAEAFARALGQAEDELAPLALLPPELRAELEAIHDRIAGVAADAGAPGLWQGALSAAAVGKAAVVIIASGSESRWQRNVLEWFALSYFNVNMSGHYERTAVCTGDAGTWDCFRGALQELAATGQINGIDLYTQVHGGADGPSAYDNAGAGVTPGDLLPQGSKLRYGMFMNCFAASSDAGFPQTFVARGGRAAYGARGVSTPTSDLAFQLYFGSWDYSFGEAVSSANAHLANWFADAWSKKKELGEITIKEAFGALEAWVED